MDKSWKILVVVVDTKCRDSLVAELLELRRELRVSLRRHDLSWHSHIFDLLLVEERWMGHADAVDEVLALGAELEDGPTAVAEADGTDLLVLFLQCL